MTHGHWPDVIDHINHDTTDNRISNLRNCSHKENVRNTTSTKGSSSKYLGVYFDASRQKWAAAISPERRKIALGRFDCERKAALAYDAAAKQHFGAFANLNFPNEA